MSELVKRILEHSEKLARAKSLASLASDVTFQLNAALIELSLLLDDLRINVEKLSEIRNAYLAEAIAALDSAEQLAKAEILKAIYAVAEKPREAE